MTDRFRIRKFRTQERLFSLPKCAFPGSGHRPKSANCCLTLLV